MSKRLNLTQLVFAVIAICLVASCSDSGPKTEAPQNKTVTINGILYNVTTTKCDNDSNCTVDGALCSDKVCVEPVIIEVDPPECSTDDPCSDGKECRGGACVAVSDPNLPECSAEKACSDGKECKDGLCVDVVTPASDRKIGESCDDTHTCVATLWCASGKCKATGDYVIPFIDPVLIAVINKAIDPARADDAPITAKDCMNNVTSLTYSLWEPSDVSGVYSCNPNNKGVISNISGIDFCGNLTSVDFSCNKIGDLTPLAGLTGLKNLDLLGNQFTDTMPLSNLKGLTLLNLGSNQLSKIEQLAPLAYLKELKTLNLVNNKIADITPIVGLKGLTSLNLGNNLLSKIEQITPLTGLTGLKELYLYSNKIADITPLASLKGLTLLQLGNNLLSKIEQITPLTGLTGLKTLYLYDNKISDITLLANLKELTVLDLGHNMLSKIEQLAPLTGLTGLTYLLLRNNQITDIAPLAGLTGLSHLDLLGNDIVSLIPLAELSTNGGLKSGSKLFIDEYPTNAKPGTTNFYNDFILNTLKKSGVIVSDHY